MKLLSFKQFIENNISEKVLNLLNYDIIIDNYIDEIWDILLESYKKTLEVSILLQIKKI